MREIITLLRCIAPILEKKAKTTLNNHRSSTIHARKNNDVRTQQVE